MAFKTRQCFFEIQTLQSWGLLEDPGCSLNVSHGGDQDLQGCNVSQLICSWCEGSPHDLVLIARLRVHVITWVNSTVLVVGVISLPKAQGAMKSEAEEVVSWDSVA